MNPFSRLFRRPAKKLPTPQEGRAILEDAIRRTLDSGLSGYVIATLTDGTDGHAVFSAKGDIALGLSKALEMLLENPQTRAAAQYAIITALKATGKAREVWVGTWDSTCDCPACTVRRAKDERQLTSKPH